MSIRTIALTCTVCGTSSKPRHFDLCHECATIRTEVAAEPKPGVSLDDQLHLKHAPARAFHLANYARGREYAEARRTLRKVAALPYHDWKHTPLPQHDLAEPARAEQDGIRPTPRTRRLRERPMRRHAFRHTFRLRRYLKAPSVSEADVRLLTRPTGEYEDGYAGPEMLGMAFDHEVRSTPLPSAYSLSRAIAAYCAYWDLTITDIEHTAFYREWQAAIFEEDRGLQEHEYPAEDSAPLNAWLDTLTPAQRAEWRTVSVLPPMPESPYATEHVTFRGSPTDARAMRLPRRLRVTYPTTSGARRLQRVITVDTDS